MIVHTLHDTRPVAICGAGGHARVVADIVRRQSPDRRIVGFLDDRVGLVGSTVAGYLILDGIESFLESGRDDCALLIGVGDNRDRRRIAEYARGLQISCTTAVHPSAEIGSDVKIGPGTVVMPNVVINSGARIGAHVIVNTGATVDHDSVVEDFAHIAPGVHLAGSVRIGEGAMVGIGSCVTPGLRIGAWATVGAGAAVIRNVMDGTTVAGTPATVLDRRFVQA